jgi:DNA-binding transcriptional LysR family regulator
LQGVHKKFPGLKVSLREGYSAQFETMLLNDEVDLAITLLANQIPAGLQSLLLLELPMVLLVEKSHGLATAEALWQRDKISEPLICLPPHEELTKNFLARLAELGTEWFPTVEASSSDLIETYVASGLGIGVSVAVPHKLLPANVRMLPLKDFPPARVGVLWRGKRAPLLDAFLDMARQQALDLK